MVSGFSRRSTETFTPFALAAAMVSGCSDGENRCFLFSACAFRAKFRTVGSRCWIFATSFKSEKRRFGEVCNVSGKVLKKKRLDKKTTPATVLITKVTIKGAGQAVQMFGPAQKAVAKAVADSVASGVIPKDQAESLVIVCGVFIHWDAKDDAKIYEYNYEATKLSIQRAMKGEPKIDEILAKKDSAKHPFFK